MRIVSLLAAVALSIFTACAPKPRPTPPPAEAAPPVRPPRPVGTRTVSIPGPAGPIPATVVAPEGRAGVAVVLFIAPGERERWEPVLRAWPSLGLAAVVVDCEKLGVPLIPGSIGCEPRAYDLDRMSGDADAAIAWAGGQFPAATMVLAAAGRYGDVALLAAARNPEVGALALLAPRLAYPVELSLDSVATRWGDRPMLLLTTAALVSGDARYDSLEEALPRLDLVAYDGLSCSTGSAMLAAYPAAPYDLAEWLVGLPGPPDDTSALVRFDPTRAEARMDTVYADLPAPREATIPASDGLGLGASVYVPPGADRPERFLLLAHGLYVDRSAWRPHIAEWIARGWGVLAFDLRGHGASVRPGDASSLWCADVDRFVERTPGDIDAAVRWLRETYDYPRIVLVGSSVGATSSLIAAGNDLSLSGIAMLSGGWDWPPGLREEDLLDRYGARPLLIVAAAGDASAAVGGRAAKAHLSAVTYAEIGGTCTHGEALLQESAEARAAIAEWFVQFEW